MNWTEFLLINRIESIFWWIKIY